MAKLNAGLRFFLLIAKWFPVVFISAVIVWSYYAYVVQLCVYEVESGAEKGLYLVFYHIVFILFAWSYWQTVFTESGFVPSQYMLTPSQKSEVDAALRERNYEQVKRLLDSYDIDVPVLSRGFNGDLRYCEKCNIIKPDRAHHCSICDRCILKMDHHCPWVNNCVCYNNYKFFVLFLGYGILYCAYVAFTDLQYFIKFWQNELRLETGGKFHILFLFFVAVMFAISLSTLFSYHIYLTVTNRTTLESHRAPIFVGGPDKNGYNLGKAENFRQVFGDKMVLWFFPIFTSKGDGYQYMVRSARNIPAFHMHDSVAMEDARYSQASHLNGHGSRINGRGQTNGLIDIDIDDRQSSTSIDFAGLPAVNSKVALVNELRS